MNYDLLLTCSCSAAIILFLFWVIDKAPRTVYKAEKWFWDISIGLITIMAVISSVVAVEAIRDNFAPVSAFDSEKEWLTWVE